MPLLLALFWGWTFTDRACAGSRSPGSGEANRIKNLHNPFRGASLYVDPGFQKAVAASALNAGAPDRANINAVSAISTAIWLDREARIASIEAHLIDALRQQKTHARPVVVTFVVYNLPNRDCASRASAGELRLSADGLARYQTFIDRIAETLRRYPSVTTALVIEPDSLANLATNLDRPSCAEAAPGYREGVAYALRTLDLPHTRLYLDVAHAGWLCWEGNLPRMRQILQEVIDAAGGPRRLRGFATNISNYNLTEWPPGADTPDRMNPCRGELDYVRRLALELQPYFPDAAFVIDTSRAGQGDIRRSWGSWCNVRGARLGPRPQANPRSDLPFVDAYLWIKRPGESDGTADPGSARADPDCGGPESLTGAPEAGEWFESYFLELARRSTSPSAPSPYSQTPAPARDALPSDRQ
jgi:cellulose 1,4-beta-cellobiosidase